jgi:hypothetical protein
MKQLIAVTFLVMLTCSINAQLHIKESRPGFRTDPANSKHFKPPMSYQSGYSIDKPTLDSCIYEEYNTSTDTWSKGLKEEFKYNLSGIPTQSSFYYWDTESNEWIPIDKKEIGINSDGNLILLVDYVYSEGQYFPYLKEEIIYNSNKLITEKIISDYQSGVLNRQKQLLYEYDGNGYPKQISYYSRNASDQPWVYSHKYEFTVDNMGRIIAELSTDYDVNADGIINFMDWIKNTFIYSTEGNLISYMVNAWDNELKKWYVSSKMEYTYNAKAQMLTENGFLLNDESGQFEIEYNADWIYDSNGNNTAHISRYLDGISGLWEMEKTELIFDLQALATDFSLPYAFEFECVNKPVGIRFYDNFIDPKWNLLYSGTYYYSNNIINKINSLAQSKVTCLQQLRNFTFSWDGMDEFLTFDVYTLAGQIVYSKKVNNNQTTTLEDLADGIYFYRLSNNKMAITGKIILK